MRWWEKRKHVLVRERSRINEAFQNNDFTFEIKDNKLWVTGTILGFFEFECKYPSSYPSAPPDIFPKDRSPQWVPKHQYPKNGRFCLNIREKTWCSRLTAADIIKSVQVLLVAEGIRKYTKSDKARKIIDNMHQELKKFVKVMPIEYRRILEGLTIEKELGLMEASDG